MRRRSANAALTTLSLIVIVSAPAAFAADRAPGRQEAREEVETLVAEGRELLASGRASEAEMVFARADSLAGGGVDTYMWVLRSWMEQGRLNDAFDAIDALAADGARGPVIDYLYGMACHRRAKTYIAQNVQPELIGFSFEDAQSYLDRATQADRERFGDAYVPLAESAWYSSRLTAARTAAERAVALDASSVPASYLLGSILLSQFMAAAGDESRADEVETLLADTVAALGAAVRVAGPPESKDEKRLAALIQRKLGMVYVRGGRTTEAVEAYAQALGWDPGAVDFRALMSELGTPESNQQAVAALEKGAKLFVERNGRDTPNDANLLWWLGYARFSDGDYEAAEPSFVAAVEKWPEHVNAWFYIGLARYHMQRVEGAIDAFRENWAVDPTDLVKSIQASRERNLAILDYIVSWCAQRQRWKDAAFVAEIRTGVFPENWEYWDNLALFLRDAGKLLEASAGEADREAARAHYLRAVEAYVKARELAPDKPHLLNDAAVVMHYFLVQDLEAARGLYQQAIAEATALLAQAGLAERDRTMAEKALRDAEHNLVKIETQLESR